MKMMADKDLLSSAPTNEPERFVRFTRMCGEEAFLRLQNSTVLLFGLGGVGGYVAEFLARSGVGRIDLVDGDCFTVSNCNRQISALQDTLGQNKATVSADRLRQINPQIVAVAHSVFFSPATYDTFDFAQYDYVVDAIDSVPDKIEIAVRAKSANVPVISAMGAGNKWDPSLFRVGDLSKTTVCPLARVMRTELRRRGIVHMPVVWSTETPSASGKGREVGSFAPAVATCGALMASRVVADLSRRSMENV